MQYAKLTHSLLLSDTCCIVALINCIASPQPLSASCLVLTSYLLQSTFLRGSKRNRCGRRHKFPLRFLSSSQIIIFCLNRLNKANKLTNVHLCISAQHIKLRACSTWHSDRDWCARCSKVLTCDPSAPFKSFWPSGWPSLVFNTFHPHSLRITNSYLIHKCSKGLDRLQSNLIHRTVCLVLTQASRQCNLIHAKN